MDRLAGSLAMQVRGQSSLLAGLGGPHWGLLPAFFILPWLLAAGLGQPGPLALWLAALMASYDLASRRIPNPLTAIAALGGLTCALALEGLSGLGQAALAGAIAFGLMAVFFFLGAVGAGDVKALGALATFLTPWSALQLFVYTTLAGGLIALARLAWARRGPRTWGGPGHWRLDAGGLELPYGLAIAAGAAITLLCGDGA